MRVLIADGQTLFREGLASLLMSDGRLNVCGQAREGSEIVSLVVRHQAEILLLSAGIPGPPPIATVAAVSRSSPGTQTVILTDSADDSSCNALLRAGAAACFPKILTSAELIRASLEIHSSAVRPSRQETRIPFTALTDREIEVLTLVARALTNRQIATELSIVEGTVKRHLSNAFQKLGASSRLDAVRKSRQAGCLLGEQ